MDALIVNDAHNVAADSAFYQGLNLLQDPDIRILSLTSDLPIFPSSSRMIGNFFLSGSPKAFSNVYLGPSLRLFPNNWGKTFVHQATNMCVGGGTTFVPLAEKNKAGYGKLTAEDIFGISDSHEVDLSVPPIAKLSPPDKSALPKVLSTLSWSSEQFNGLILFDLLMRSSSRIRHTLLKDPLASEFCALSEEDIAQHAVKEEFASTLSPTRYSGEVPWSTDEMPVDLNRELQRTIKAMSYYIAGIGYKSAMIKHIIRSLRGDGPMRYADFGGGYGLLAAEFCLDPDFAGSRAFIRDILPGNMMFATLLYRQLRDDLKKRFVFSLGAAETLETLPPQTVITFIGSLLYVPKQKRQDVLRKCWDALEPGGLLIIHENIKNPSFTKDFDIMFTTSEIEDLMSEFGSIRRFLSTATKEVQPEQMQDKAVFRAIAKT